MKKKVYFLICFLVMSGLASCSFPAPYERIASEAEKKKQYQAVSALLTKTAQSALVLETPAAVTGSPALVMADSPNVLPIATDATAIATASAAADAAVTAAAITTDLPPARAEETAAPAYVEPDGEAHAAPCNLAQLGFPIDINVPDGTRFQPGEIFSKTWRLVNAGTCAWTPDYAVIWFSGDEMGINQSQLLNAVVPPGGSIDITVDMLAPLTPGTYQSNWKMTGSDGAMFGIGPTGDAPFWVRIVVVPVDTPTVPAPVIEATPTPLIFARGSLVLSLGEAVDLDSAQLNQAENDDLRLQGPVAESVQLAPQTGARMAVFGSSPPQISDCDQAMSNEAPVIVEQEQVGAYYCYWTSKGLPGWIQIRSIDLELGQVELEFLTWVVP